MKTIIIEGVVDEARQTQGVGFLSVKQEIAADQVGEATAPGQKKQFNQVAFRFAAYATVKDIEWGKKAKITIEIEE